MKLIDNLRDRYHGWTRLAYLGPGERRLNRALWTLLVIALAFAFAHHVCLVNIPSPVSWGPPVGLVFYDLAIAYAGSFIFYVLVVRIPLRWDRASVYRHVGPLIGLIITHADELMTSLNKAAHIEPPDRESTWPNIQDLCSRIGPTSPAEGRFVSTKGIAQHTVFTVIVDRMNRTKAGISEILSFSPHVVTELVDILVAIETYSHFQSFSEQAMIIQNTGIPIANQTLSVWAHQIFNYTKLIRDVKDYASEFGLPTTYESRPGLIAVAASDPQPG